MRYLPKKQLKVWLPLLILIPLWSGSFLTAHLAERALIQDVHERLLLALHSYEAYLDTTLDDQERNLRLYLDGAVRNSKRGGKVPRFEWDYLSRHVPEAVGCLAFDLRRRLVAQTQSGGKGPPFEVRGAAPMNLTETRLTDPVGDATDPSGRSFYDMFFPWIISDQSSYGTAAGTFVCRLNNTLSQVLAQYRQALGLTGDVFLVSAKSRLMLTESRAIPQMVGQMMVDTEGVRRALTGESTRAFYRDSLGTPVMGAALVLPERGWILLAEIAEYEAMEPVYRLRLVLGASVALVSIVASLLGWRYGKQVEERERIASELHIASDIQRSILPHCFPPFPDRDEFDLYAATVPAREIGGDFFDFFFIDRERLAVVIADVSGKGMPAALFMAVTRTMLRGTAVQVPSPAECLFHVNNLLCHDNDEAMFVTVFYAVLNTRTGELAYSNAGHNPPYLVSGEGKASVLAQRGGMALGVMPDHPYEESHLRLNCQDSLFLYTDGVTEAMDRYGNQFSVGRLEVLLHNSRESPSELVKRTVADVHVHAGGESQSDDITVLALRYLGNKI